MNISSHTITRDETGIPRTILIDQATLVQNSIQQEDARNGDEINLSLKNDPSTTLSPDHLQHKLRTNTEYDVDWIVAHKQTPNGTLYIVQWYGCTPSSNSSNHLTTYEVI